MRRITDALALYLSDRDGAVMIEYALLIALLAMGAFVALGNLGDSLSEIFGLSSSTLDEHHPS